MPCEGATKVLIAESDLAFAAKVQLALEKAGYQVTVAEDSFRAWDLLQSDRPSLLITRLSFGPGKVPGTALGSRAKGAGIPVIYVPLNADGAVHASYEHGAVLIKPVEMTELVATARGLLLGAHAGAIEEYA